MSEFWILVAINVVGFILTWIICSKPVSESDWKDIDSNPGAFFHIEDYEKTRLRLHVSTLESKLYSLQREIDYWRGGRYDRPVEVNIENIVKVTSEKLN